ncbi:MAG: nitrite reductase [Methylophaga sp.]|nr:MAG: nitrite reductase [Methylophaga sp.]
MTSKHNKSGTKHYDAYPEGEVSPLLAYAFRPLFILLPAYIALSILVWGLVWSGQLPLFTENILAWHIYEMMFGVASAGIIGFILTAVPELYDDVKPVVGKTVLAITALWLVGRIAFWMIDWLGVYVVALTNLPLLIWVTALVAKPIFLDPLRRNISLALTFISIILIQAWFFAAMAGWVDTDFIKILKVALGAFMVLELLALRRINTEAINEWLEQHHIDDTFIARPPRYNIAILCVTLFTIVEFIIPDNAILGWLGLAAAAAILNTLNDFFIDEATIFFRSYILPLFLILILMALGYGFMGFAYLSDNIHSITHFRHFLTTGVFGLSFLMVMVIVGTIHTGRSLQTNRWIDFSVILIIIATLLRSLIPFVPEYTTWFYLSSSIIWAIPFIIYLILFYPFLSQPRADGLLG